MELEYCLKPTFLRLGIGLVCKACLFEWPPFEILLVSSTGYVSFLALLASRLGLIAFEPFRLTCDAAWNRASVRILLERRIVVASENRLVRSAETTIPLRLFDSFGLLTPPTLFAAMVPVEDLVEVGLERLVAGLVDSV